MTRTTTYHCEDFRPIRLGEHVNLYNNDIKREVRSVDDAAKAFGLRLARRRYGKRAYCRNVLEDYHNVKQFHYDAWIGKPDGTGLKGQSVRLCVTYKIAIGG